MGILRWRDPAARARTYAPDGYAADAARRAHGPPGRFDRVEDPPSHPPRCPRGDDRNRQPLPGGASGLRPRDDTGPRAADRRGGSPRDRGPGGRMMDLGSATRRPRTATQEREIQIDRLLGKRFMRTTVRMCAAPSLMTVLAVVVGVALLGLAGWFIAASAVAGLAAASTFSFLFPSAGVQALAWARTLARYGERITTHRATLDLGAALRTALFATAVRLPRDRAADLRSSELIGRLTTDSDAVEQILLRSAFPITAAAAAALGAITAFNLLSTWVGAVATAGLGITAA